MTLPLTGIHHVALNVRDLDRAEQFYTEVLGFSVTHRFSTGLRHLMMFTGNAHIALFEAPELELDSALDRLSEQGYQHLAFGIAPEAFDPMVASLKKQVDSVEGPVQRGQGRSVYFNDPDGNHLEIHYDEA